MLINPLLLLLLSTVLEVQFYNIKKKNEDKK